MQYRKLIDVLLDSSHFADVVLKGGYFINVITREIYEADIAMKGEYILMAGDAKDLIGPKTIVENIQGNSYVQGLLILICILKVPC